MKLEAKRIIMVVLAAIMVVSFAVTVSAEDSQVVYYFVDCGDADPTTVNDGDSLGNYNSVTDQFFGADASTGKQWGVVDQGVDTTGQAQYNDKRVTTTWTWVDTPGDGADKGASNRFCHDMKQADMDRVITYKFELPENGEYTVEVGFANPWGIALPADVYLNGTNVGTCSDTASPVIGKATVKDGYITVEAKSDMETINLAYIIITGSPIPEDSGSTTTPDTGSGNQPSQQPDDAPQTGVATFAFAAAALGAGAYIVSKKRH